MFSHTLIYPPEEVTQLPATPADSLGTYPPNPPLRSCPSRRRGCPLLLLSSTSLSLRSHTIINVTVTLLLCCYYHHCHYYALPYYQRCCLPHLCGAIIGTSGAGVLWAFGHNFHNYFHTHIFIESSFSSTFIGDIIKSSPTRAKLDIVIIVVFAYRDNLGVMVW